MDFTEEEARSYFNVISPEDVPLPCDNTSESLPGETGCFAI